MRRQLFPLHPSRSSPKRLWVRSGLGKDTLGPGDSHLSGPNPLPSALNSTLQKSCRSPSLNSSEWRSAAGTSPPLSPCPVPSPGPAKRHAPRSPRPPQRSRGRQGTCRPATHTAPTTRSQSPRGAWRSPVARLVVARRRGRAAGRGRRAARGAGLANLRRRSPRYVYLGRLTPALPARSAGALAREPVGHPGWSGALRRERPRGLRLRAEGRRRESYGPGAHGSGWGGGGAAALVAPARPSPRPRPGGAPAAATHRPAGPRGRAREI